METGGLTNNSIRLSQVYFNNKFASSIMQLQKQKRLLLVNTHMSTLFLNKKAATTPPKIFLK
jgi:hypothetical protein